MGSRCRTWLAWLAPVLLAAFCFWQAVPEPRSIVPEASAAVSTGASPHSASAEGLRAPPAAERRLLTRPIEEIRVGQRVLAENPELAGLRLPDTPIDPATWRTVELRMSKPDGSELEIALLRPLEWLVFTGAAEGAVIDLDLAELGAAGPAEVLRIASCPPIESGPGRVVTGTFAHSAANVLDLYISGLDEPIGVTANHPIWSEDRQRFVGAAELRTGETLRRPDRSRTTVIGMTTGVGTHEVYNLEVDADHVYYVSRDGVLVHNICRHHSIPKFMGGHKNQPLTPLQRSVHIEYHRELSAQLRARGLPPMGGPTGNTDAWRRYMQTHPGGQARAFDAVLDAARITDQRYRTSIFRSSGFRMGAALKYGSGVQSRRPRAAIIELPDDGASGTKTSGKPHSLPWPCLRKRTSLPPQRLPTSDRPTQKPEEPYFPRRMEQHCEWSIYSISMIRPCHTISSAQ